MGILLVTGQIAKESVKEFSAQAKTPTKTLALPVSVAALLTTKQIIKHLKTGNLQGIETILVPGLVRGDAAEIEREVGITTYKGPRHAADIPLALDALREFKLSKKVPADSVLQQKFSEKIKKELLAFEKEAAKNIDKLGNLKIENVRVGKDFPPRVMTEIVNVPFLSDKKILARAEYYLDSGADILDIGMVAGETHVKKAKETIQLLKDNYAVPVSIDTLNSKEIMVAVEAGVDLVLSLDAGNVSEVGKTIAENDVAVVVLPTDHIEGYHPKKAEDKVTVLEKNIEVCRSLGIEKILADPVLDGVFAPSLSESLKAYWTFSRKHPDTPLFMGVGNVSELLDADSIGVNALLAGLAAEIGIAIVFTPEASVKTTGSVRELSQAVKMMMLAKKRRSPPKDVGIDLLRMKEKMQHTEKPNLKMLADFRQVRAREIERFGIDPAGIYRIYVVKDEIWMVQMDRSGQAKQVIVGSNAKELTDTLAEKGLVSRMEHMGYLGRELQKAEIALKTGKSYSQDFPIF